MLNIEHLAARVGQLRDGGAARATHSVSLWRWRSGCPNAPGIHGPTKHVFFHGRADDATGDTHIHEFRWDGNPRTWHHDDLTQITGAPLTQDSPSSYMFKGRATKHVIYQGFDKVRGNDGRINELLWDGHWHHNDLSAAAHPPGDTHAPFTIGQPFGYEYSFFDTINNHNNISRHVVYRTIDQQLSFLSWGGPAPLTENWHPSTFLPDVPGGVSPPTAYIFSVQGHEVQGQASQRVLYLSPHMVPDIQHVHELSWNEKGPNLFSWVLNDLTVLTGAPPLGNGDANPVGLMHDLEFTLHVFYGRNQDRHLYELYWNELGWHVNDLTAIMGSTDIAESAGFDSGPPLAYVHLQQGTLNVNYLGTDGHIHALWRDVGTPWNNVNKQNLTMPIGAPPPLSQPVGFVFRDLTQHLFYIANNSLNSHIGDIIELTDE